MEEKNLFVVLIQDLRFPLMATNFAMLVEGDSPEEAWDKAQAHLDGETQEGDLIAVTAVTPAPIEVDGHVRPLTEPGPANPRYERLQGIRNRSLEQFLGGETVPELPELDISA